MKNKRKILIVCLIVIFLLIFNNLFYVIINNVNKFFLIDNKRELETNTLKIENNELKIINEELSNYLKLEPFNFDYVMGEVIVNNIYNNSLIVINKGTKDGVKVSDEVINHIGLVGIVSKVFDNKSLVKLIIDDNNISVKVNDSYGILYYDDGLKIKIKNNNMVNIDDRIYTSGLTNVLGNIYIGKVSSIYSNNFDLELILSIERNDIFNMHYVIVIKDKS